ncbi:protein ALP1-like [Helianthus annuus]|uniref:protein ALP1-like n=1 Tax=Helianthus annuus TaxID=4232 RepID=UPI000B8F150C|nr:protein ALP1-like [Helianthus annuus]
MLDYFCENPLYDDEQFRRRFRISRRLFLKISSDLAGEFPFFTQRESAGRKIDFSGIQKCTAAIRQLAYNTTSDAWDEYLRMSARSCHDCLENLCEGVIFLYGRQYLRMPTAADIPFLYEAHQRIHGFPGMLGSLDCAHWEWATCPTAWKGQHHCGDHDGPTLILQAVASQDLLIWHAYFGMAGANNDITVLQSSNLLDDVIDGVAPDTSFYENDVKYKYGYYLTDDIYPEWATFVKTLSCPDYEKRMYYKKKQESTRKDIELTFGVFKKRWSIIAQPPRIHEKSKMRNVMYTCIILHNIVLEDSGRAFCGESYDESSQPTNPLLTYPEIEVIQARIRDRDTHHNLRADLTEHLWFYREQGGDDADDD